MLWWQRQEHYNVRVYGERMIDTKHILFVVENNEVIGDIRVLSEARAAKKFGYQVSVICPVSEKYAARYEQIGGVDIYRHPVRKKKGGKLGFLLEYMQALFWEIYYSICIYIKKPFHAIHGANPPDLIVVVALLFKPFGVKYIYDLHDLAPELFITKFGGRKKMIYWVLFLLEKISCKCSDVIVTTNNSYKQIVAARHDIHPDKIKIVRNDPHVDFFETSGRLNRKANRKVHILYLGSINSQDGVDGLLYALDCLVSRLAESNFICSIVGDGESLPAVKALSADLRLDAHVQFPGFVYDREIIQGFLDTADICVEPAPDNALNRHSTFIKIMEYMAAKKPIVAFDLKETVFSTGGDACLVKSGDIVGFARAIKTLIDQPKWRKQLGNDGFKRIKDDLNWQKAEANLKRAYECAVN